MGAVRDEAKEIIDRVNREQAQKVYIGKESRTKHLINLQKQGI